MSRHPDVSGGEEENEEVEDLSGSENDDAFDEDMEALRRACMSTGVSAGSLENNDGGENGVGTPVGTSGDADDDGGVNALDSDNEDDVELLRNIRSRFSVSDDVGEPLSMKPLCTMPPLGFSDDDDQDDFETLRAIQRRFSAYDNADTPESCSEGLSRNQQQVHAFGIASDNETSTDILNRSNTYEDFPDSQQSCITIQNLEAASNKVHSCHETENMAIEPFDSVEPIQQVASGTSIAPFAHSSFPESAQAFVDALKKNRSYQRFLRSKLTHIEARIEENTKLKERVRILRDFQASCKKMTGRALSQKRDPRVELISARKSGTQENNEDNDKKVGPMRYGPSENCHVSNYRMALVEFPVSVDRSNWSKEELDNLANGIRQQIQEMLLQVSVDRFSSPMLGSGEATDLDQILASIKGLEVTPEMMRQFLPKVNWDQLASMYLKGRSGAECEARWLNWEDPLINHGPWTAVEENKLLHCIQEKGIKDWLDIAVLLGNNRTPFQCLARYQRSLNASIIKKDWTEEEDDQLRMAVELHGEHDWQSVAAMLAGRTGTQCSNRWKKSLHPIIQIKGKWTSDEDKRLKVAVMLFGAANWNKIAQFVPGRIQTQCRERWKNSLDPSLNHGPWTEEEDDRLIAAVAKHGKCWSKVATHVPARTDNQCWRRWKVLFPEEVPLMQEARRWKQKALIANFVDREAERPAICLSSIMSLPMISSVPERENISLSKRRRKKRREPEPAEPDETSINAEKKIRPKRTKKRAKDCWKSYLELSDGHESEICEERNAAPRKKTKNPSAALENGSALGALIRCTAPNVQSQDLLPLPPESCRSGISTGVKTSGRKKNKRKKSNLNKLLARRNTFAESDSIPLDNEQGMTTNDLRTDGDCSSSRDLARLSSTCGEEEVVSCETGREKTSSPQSKKNIVTTDAENDLADWDVTLASYIRSRWDVTIASYIRTRLEKRKSRSRASDKETGLACDAGSEVSRARIRRGSRAGRKPAKLIDYI